MLLEVVYFKPRAEAWEPPRRGFLDEVGVTAIRQHFACRPGVDGEKPVKRHDAMKVIQYVIDAFGFNVF